MRHSIEIEPQIQLHVFNRKSEKLRKELQWIFPGVKCCKSYDVMIVNEAGSLTVNCNNTTLVLPVRASS